MSDTETKIKLLPEIKIMQIEFTAGRHVSFEEIQQINIQYVNYKSLKKKKSFLNIKSFDDYLSKFYKKDYLCLKAAAIRHNIGL